MSHTSHTVGPAKQDSLLEEGVRCHPESGNPGSTGLFQGRVTQTAFRSPVEEGRLGVAFWPRHQSGQARRVEMMESGGATGPRPSSSKSPAATSPLVGMGKPTPQCRKALSQRTSHDCMQMSRVLTSASPNASPSNGRRFTDGNDRFCKKNAGCGNWRTAALNTPNPCKEDKEGSTEWGGD